MDTKILYQAVLFGIVTILLGLILSLIFGFLVPALPAECQEWDANYAMEINLFFIGFIIRFGLEYPQIRQYLYST